MRSLALFFIVLFFHKNLYSQRDSNLVRIIQNIDSSKTKIGDTIQIQFQNIGKQQLAYSFEIISFRDSDYYYNPFYSQYYNHKLSYKKLQDMFSHHLPVVPSSNWSVEIKELKPNKTAKIFFIVKKQVSHNTLIKIRINIFGEDGIIGESIISKIDSSPFPFVLIQE